MFLSCSCIQAQDRPIELPFGVIPSLVTEVNFSCLEVKSRTEVKQPVERDRRNIGIGEVVSIYPNLGFFTGKRLIWSYYANPQPSLHSFTTKPGDITLVAGEVEGDIIIRCKISRPGAASCNASLKSFDTKVPRLLNVYPTSECNFHLNGVPSIGALAKYYVLPDNVNFHNVLMAEKDELTPGTGYFLGQNKGHVNDTSGITFAPLTANVVKNRGTEDSGFDILLYRNEKSSFKNDSPWMPGGYFHWDVPILYVVSNTIIPSAQLYQVLEKVPFRITLEQGGAMEITKSSEFSLRKELNDPDECINRKKYKP